MNSHGPNTLIRVERAHGAAIALAAVLLLSSPGRLAAQPGIAPQYAFNGAYAAYKMSVGSFSQPYSMTITDVSPAGRTFKISVQIGKDPQQGAVFETMETFDQHPSLLALSVAELNQLRMGFVPGSLNLPGTQLSHGVVISVAAGRFTTEEVHSAQASSWFENSTGLLVKSVGPTNWTSPFERLGLPSALAGVKPTLELMSTNIPTVTPPPPLPWTWIIVGAGALAVASGVYFLLSRLRRTGGVSKASDRPLTAKPSAATGLVEKIVKLKALLDQGVITREDFEREKARLLGM